ncbi:MAG: hypothetical protein ACI9A1_002076 [Lentimonas sp.]|jgi:hypothetical protein
MCLAVAAGSHAEEFLKFADEVAVVVKPDFLGDLADGVVAVHENLAGTREAIADQEARGRLLKDSAKTALELTDR